MLQTKPRYVTVIELISRKPNIAESIEAGGIVRDYMNIDISSHRPIPYAAITKEAEKYPDYMIGAISEFDMDDNRYDEF